ncbi:MAG: pyridoxal 5'-phosphate synthase glutaminase subunit PdxT [Candidatus Altiarchaeota archaeon]|nr:pyridoxal 5'-phosphate synthase glutaminase subunit PdxT [Candidatus Altiarchaeota archaeon]
MKVGVLSLQGDVSEHVRMTGKAIEDLKLEGEVIKVKTLEGIEGLDALIIPGGESTTLGKLITLYRLDKEIRDLADNGVPIMGTCAGLILLGGGGGYSLGLMDITVERNAFGRQRESFEVDLSIPALGDELYHAVFIRAPVIKGVGEDVEALAEYDGRTVMARQDKLIAVAFHPESTMDTRVHKYFLGLLGK